MGPAQDHYDATPEGAPAVEGDDGKRPSPYAGGLFRLSIRLERDYPMSPPKVQFNTKVWHPNVTEAGELRVDFLSSAWTSGVGLRYVLQAVRSLLAMPNADDHVNSAAAREMKDSIEAFEKHAAADTERFAMD